MFDLDLDAAAIAHAVTPYVLDALLCAIAGHKEQPMTRIAPPGDLKRINVIFRSGAKEGHHVDESTLSSLITDWRAALAGDCDPKQRVRRYDVYSLHGCATLCLLLDITALESIQVLQQTER